MGRTSKLRDAEREKQGRGRLSDPKETSEREEEEVVVRTPPSTCARQPEVGPEATVSLLLAVSMRSWGADRQVGCWEEVQRFGDQDILGCERKERMMPPRESVRLSFNCRSEVDQWRWRRGTGGWAQVSFNQLCCTSLLV